MSQIIIDQSYEINQDTMALIPAKHMDYATIVFEENESLYIKERSMTTIRIGCLEGGADYDGRRQSVIYKTGIHNKVPIPINPLEHIFAFPTQSPDIYECVWIFYHHIRFVSPNRNNPTQSIITFNNGQTLTVNMSYPGLQKQIQRTALCITRFSKM